MKERERERDKHHEQIPFEVLTEEGRLFHSIFLHLILRERPLVLLLLFVFIVIYLFFLHEDVLIPLAARQTHLTLLPIITHS